MGKISEYEAATSRNPNAKFIDAESGSNKTYTPDMILGYKSYAVLISQSGTDNPTVKPLLNTIGNIAWSYISEGLYQGVLSGAFVEDKTFLMINQEFIADNRAINFVRIDANTVQLNVARVTTGVVLDGLLNDTSLEIRVYF